MVQASAELKLYLYLKYGLLGQSRYSARPFVIDVVMYPRINVPMSPIDCVLNPRLWVER